MRKHIRKVVLSSLIIIILVQIFNATAFAQEVTPANAHQNPVYYAQLNKTLPLITELEEPQRSNPEDPNDQCLIAGQMDERVTLPEGSVNLKVVNNDAGNAHLGSIYYTNDHEGNTQLPVYMEAVAPNDQWHKGFKGFVRNTGEIPTKVGIIEVTATQVLGFDWYELPANSGWMEISGIMTTEANENAGIIVITAASTISNLRFDNMQIFVCDSENIFLPLVSRTTATTQCDAGWTGRYLQIGETRESIADMLYLKLADVKLGKTDNRFICWNTQADTAFRDFGDRTRTIDFESSTDRWSFPKSIVAMILPPSKSLPQEAGKLVAKMGKVLPHATVFIAEIQPLASFTGFTLDAMEVSSWINYMTATPLELYPPFRIWGGNTQVRHLAKVEVLDQPNVQLYVYPDDRIVHDLYTQADLYICVNNCATENPDQLVLSRYLLDYTGNYIDTATYSQTMKILSLITVHPEMETMDTEAELVDLWEEASELLDDSGGIDQNDPPNDGQSRVCRHEPRKGLIPNYMFKIKDEIPGIWEYSYYSNYDEFQAWCSTSGPPFSVGTICYVNTPNIQFTMEFHCKWTDGNPRTGWPAHAYWDVVGHIPAYFISENTQNGPYTPYEQPIGPGFSMFDD